jgi:hypothetical protein
MAPNVTVMTYDCSATYEDDLEFVRRQLDDLGLVRAMGQSRPVDDIRYQSLCHKEHTLLARSRRDSVAS